MKNLNKITIAVLLVAGLFVSCSKESEDVGPSSTKSSTQTNKTTVADKATSIIKTFGNLQVSKANQRFTTPNGVTYIEDGEEFNFSSAEAGVSIASSDGITFVPGDNGGYVYANPTGGSFGSGGGTVVAGNTLLNIDFAICLAVNDDDAGYNPFGGFFDFEVGSIIGYAGNFESILNGEIDPDDEEVDPSDYFHGFAGYFVFAEELDGTFNVIDFLEEADEDEEELEGLAFSWVFDLQKGKIYISSGGNMTVKGGGMTFNGDYVELAALFSDFDLDGGLFNPKPVSGFGTMTCN